LGKTTAHEASTTEYATPKFAKQATQEHARHTGFTLEAQRSHNKNNHNDEQMPLAVLVV